MRSYLHAFVLYRLTQEIISYQDNIVGDCSCSKSSSVLYAQKKIR